MLPRTAWAELFGNVLRLGSLTLFSLLRLVANELTRLFASCAALLIFLIPLAASAQEPLVPATALFKSKTACLRALTVPTAEAADCCKGTVYVLKL